MSRFDAASQQPSPVGNGVDVIDVVKADVEKIGHRENAQAAYSMIDPYDYAIWLAAKFRATLGGESVNPYEGVANDLERRAEVGSKKYGTRLKTNNGRNALYDSYQELLDFANYLCQARLEGKI